MPIGTVTWSNAHTGPEGAMDASQQSLTLAPISLSLQLPFDSSAVLSCYEKAYHSGGSKTPSPCVGVTSSADMFFTIPGNYYRILLISCCYLTQTNRC